MAFTKNIFIFTFLVVIVSGKSNGKTYKVGDSTGWTNTGQFDYKTWATVKTFRVGDKILFEYNNQYHNVVRVTHKNFNLCNATAPYGTMDTGHDVFTIKKLGHFYFICGAPGHCDAGQRVDIRVFPELETAPISPGGSSPYGPAPTPSSSSTLTSFTGLLQSNLGLSIFALVSAAYGFGL